MKSQNKSESIDWEKVNGLGYIRATRLRAIEHALVLHPEGVDPASLCALIGLDGRAKQRTLQNDLNELRDLYIGKQVVSHAPHRLILNGDDLAFPEAEFSTNDRKQLNAICRLIAFFDGAIPVRDFLRVSIKDVDTALKDMSDNIDIPASSTELKFIKEIYDSIENRTPIDILYPRLNNGKAFAFSPYMLKRFNNKWFVIGRMAVENPFEWTLIPLSGIDVMAQHKGEIKYSPSKQSQLGELKRKIRNYYSHVIGYHVPVAVDNPENISRELDPELLDIREIVLHANDTILRFIKENPIHQTQLIFETKNEIRLQLVINPLLKQRILAYGAGIEVISPVDLRKEIALEAQKMLACYEAK